MIETSKENLKINKLIAEKKEIISRRKMKF